MHAEWQEVCSSIQGQQLRRHYHQIEFSLASHKGHICRLIEVAILKQMSASRCSNHEGTQGPPHGTTCMLASRFASIQVYDTCTQAIMHNVLCGLKFQYMWLVCMQLSQSQFTDRARILVTETLFSFLLTIMLVYPAAACISQLRCYL